MGSSVPFSAWLWSLKEALGKVLEPVPPSAAAVGIKVILGT